MLFLIIRKYYAYFTLSLTYRQNDPKMTSKMDPKWLPIWVKTDTKHGFEPIYRYLFKLVIFSDQMLIILPQHDPTTTPTLLKKCSQNDPNTRFIYLGTLLLTYVLLLTTTYCDLLPLTTTTTTTYYSLLLLTTTYYYLLRLAMTYYYLLRLATTYYYYLLPLINIYYYLLVLTSDYHCLLAITTTYYYLLFSYWRLLHLSALSVPS